MQLDKGKRLAAWAFVLLVLYSATMAFVMFFSLASAFEKFQSIAETGSITKSFDAAKLQALQNDASRARAAANDITVVALEWLPWIGSDVHAARVLSAGLDENLQAIAPLIEQRDTLTLGESDLPKTLEALSNSLDSLDVAITRFDQNLVTVKTTELHFGLSPKVQKLKDTIATVKLSVHEGTPLLKTAAILLNQPGKTRWFVATQNAAELRASGGLLGSYALITIQNGKVSLTDFGADSKLLAKGKLHVNFASGIGNPWGGDLTDWRDLNVSSNIPENGQIITDAWEEKFHQKLDGVVFFSQGTVAHLIGAVGGIQVKGQVLDSQNAVSFLTKDIYAKFKNVKTKNLVVSSMMKQLFGKLSSNKINPTKLFGSLSKPTNIDDLYLWSNNKAVEEKIISAGLSGSITNHTGSNVVIGLNNGGGNKLDAYLKTEYLYSLGNCGVETWDGLPGRAATLKVKLTNNAPRMGLPAYVNPRLDLRTGQKWEPSSNREIVSIYAPVGTTDEQFFIDGVEDGAVSSSSQNHPLYIFNVELKAGQTRTITMTFIEPIVDVNGRPIESMPSLRTQRTLGGSASKIIRGEVCKVG
jgi:hypothetical protein